MEQQTITLDPTSQGFLERIIEHCQAIGYPASLLDALIRYLATGQHLQAVVTAWHVAYPQGTRKTFFGALWYWKRDAPALNELERRLLNVSLVTGMLRECLIQLSERDVFTEVKQHVLSQGMSEQALAHEAFKLLDLVVEPGTEDVTYVGQFLCSFLPTYFSELVEQVNRYPWSLPAACMLLLNLPTPALALIEQLVQSISFESTIHQSNIRQVALLLLKADRERFLPWIRTLAGPQSPVSLSTRTAALRILLDQDLVGSAELAFAAAQLPCSWSSYHLQSLGLHMAYRADPQRAWPFITQQTLNPFVAASQHALQYVLEAPFEEARPILERCVVEGAREPAQKALKTLLTTAWEGRTQYAFTLLTQHKKWLRDAASSWLATQGAALFDDVEPFLHHRSADVRLSVVRLLKELGSPRLHTVLAEHLRKETALPVKQAILDIIGVPGAPAPQHIFPTPSIDDFLANAQATQACIPRLMPPYLAHQHLPVLSWDRGEPLPEVMMGYLLFLQARTPARAKLEPAVAQILTCIDRSSSADTAWSIFQGWLAAGARDTDAWCLPLCCSLGDDRLVEPLVGRIETWQLAKQRALAADALLALGLLGTHAALTEIKRLSQTFRYGPLNRAARAVLRAAGW